MMRYYQALNYLQKGDDGRARAEIFRLDRRLMIQNRFGIKSLKLLKLR